MAEPETDRGDVDEAQETLGGLVVTGGDAAGVLQLVEAALDQVAQALKGAIHGDTQFAALAHRDHRHDVARLHGFSNLVRVIAVIRQKDARHWQGVVHDQIEARVV